MPVLNPGLSKQTWSIGDAAVLRGLGKRCIWWALPVKVAQDTPELVALYWRAGSHARAPAKRPVVEDVAVTGEPILVDWLWKDTDVLMLAVPGEPYCVYAMWEAGTACLRQWYINLQEPLRRTQIGFDTMDHLLDVVISPDWSEWHWKDEDELERAVRLGVFSRMKADQIRRNGERALEVLLSGSPPFGMAWKDWRPPQEWVIPELPENWDMMLT